ncbi:glycosyltransferase family 4 protein [Brevundimonas sanguinis]|uniref:glycosyltransferase family 4 protein n=1 Tax=Brevundimonas sanguinis TaxID=3021811 RepID=UPI0024153551|nr:MULTISPECIES: glycosyltransferase family 4 protein [Brevundimonas]
MDSPSNPANVALVVPSLFHRDGIGHAVLSTRQALKESGFNVTVFCRKSDFEDADIVLFDTALSLAVNESYLKSDIIIFFVGIDHRIFDIVWMGNGRALKIVRFHNITPNVIANDIVESSSESVQNSYPYFINSADVIWCDSEFNKRSVIAHNVAAEVIPLPVRNIKPSSTRWSAKRLIKIIYVGRLVKSKNVKDLLLAVEILSAAVAFPVQLTLAGSSRHADAAILELIRDQASRAAGSYRIQLRLDLSQAALDRLYRESDIFATASLHEGFCIPVLEALSAGALPVTYSNSNLKYIGGGLAVLSHSDTPNALAAALEEASHMLLNRPADDHEPYLKVQAGTFSFAEFDIAAGAYLQNFTLKALGSQMIRSIDKKMRTRAKAR